MGFISKEVSQKSIDLGEQIEAIWTIYTEAISKFAADIFKKDIQPFLIENNYRFYADAYWGWFVEGDKVLKPEELPDMIRIILQMEVTGIPTTDLGSLMPDYEPGTDQ